MKLVTGAEMREIDRKAREVYGIPELVLMENAGVQVAESARSWLEENHKKRILILSGSGNNGGDGLAAARHLLNKGIDVRVLFLTPAEKLGPSCRVQFEILQRMGCSYQIADMHKNWHQVQEWIRTADLIIDGIYGTGFHGSLSEISAAVAADIQQADIPVLAVDIPSGVEADTGNVTNSAVRAEMTVTLALPKPGLFLGAGAAYTGKIEVKDIGMPFPLMKDENLLWNFSTLEDILNWIPKRHPDSHKGNYGHAVIVGGSGGMLGAVRMSSKAALRTGAGCVTAVVPQSLQDAVQTAEMEIMTKAVSENEYRQFSIAAAEEILDFVQKDTRKNVLVLGPGMGRFDEAGALVKSLIQDVDKPMVIDADGLRALAGQTEILRQAPAARILTPHPGEMAALTGLSIADIEKARIPAVLKYARMWQAVVVLKGHHTLAASPQGELWMNSTGNSGMASAGSGDILSGIIAGFCAQGVEPFRAAVTGVYVHGAAGDWMRDKMGEHGMIAGDLLRGIPEVLHGMLK